MLVSWNWLKQYVPLDMPPAELVERLMMAGLNHEGTQPFDDDLVVELEVTSNRPDCLGHLGVAREVSVLWGVGLQIPAAEPRQGGVPLERLARVRIDCPDLCPRYTARVVRGVRVGPSPVWLAGRLEAVGITPVNNVVDVSNYVMMECGQPLHTFDYDKLWQSEIIVRRPLAGEALVAIDHKTYALDPEMCVIADGREAVAIGGVMGGAQTEVSAATTAVLVEAAEFDPVSIRTTARRLCLHSDSSFRFERRVDPEGIDWASRRCCQLILELGGGELAAGVLDVGRPPEPRRPIVLRLAELKRILGVEVPPPAVRRILLALGNVEVPKGTGPFSSDENRDSPPDENRASPRVPAGATEPAGETMSFVPPSWRRDLAREIDLVEEVARIHGYDKIPEDASVPMVPSARRSADRVLEKVRQVLLAAGFDEAITLSAVDEPSARAVPVWTRAEPLRSPVPVTRGADRLRTSLVPSLLAARRTNEALANPEIELFEIAKIYLPAAGLPEEWLMLGLTSGRDYACVKGVIETIVAALNPALRLESDDAGIDLLEASAGCRLMLEDEMLGYVGRLADAGLKRFDLRGSASVAEIRLGPLVESAALVPQFVPLPAYPAGDPRSEPGGRRGGSLGPDRSHGPPRRRRAPGKPPVPRHVPRPRAAGPGQEEPPVDHHPSLVRGHAHQSRGRRGARPDRRRVPPRARGGTSGLSGPIENRSLLGLVVAVLGVIGCRADDALRLLVDRERPRLHAHANRILLLGLGWYSPRVPAGETSAIFEGALLHNGILRVVDGELGGVGPAAVDQQIVADLAAGTTSDSCKESCFSAFFPASPGGTNNRLAVTTGL